MRLGLPLSFALNAILNAGEDLRRWRRCSHAPDGGVFLPLQKLLLKGLLRFCKRRLGAGWGRGWSQQRVSGRRCLCASRGQVQRRIHCRRHRRRRRRGCEARHVELELSGCKFFVKSRVRCAAVHHKRAAACVPRGSLFVFGQERARHCTKRLPLPSSYFRDLTARLLPVPPLWRPDARTRAGELLPVRVACAAAQRPLRAVAGSEVFLRAFVSSPPPSDCVPARNSARLFPTSLGKTLAAPAIAAAPSAAVRLLCLPSSPLSAQRLRLHFSSPSVAAPSNLLAGAPSRRCPALAKKRRTTSRASASSGGGVSRHPPGLAVLACVSSSIKAATSPSSLRARVCTSCILASSSCCAAAALCLSETKASSTAAAFASFSCVSRCRFSKSTKAPWQRRNSSAASFASRVAAAAFAAESPNWRSSDASRFASARAAPSSFANQRTHARMRGCKTRRRSGPVCLRRLRVS